jgi:hypothetical protein
MILQERRQNRTRRLKSQKQGGPAVIISSLVACRSQCSGTSAEGVNDTHLAIKTNLNPTHHVTSGPESKIKVEIAHLLRKHVLGTAQYCRIPDGDVCLLCLRRHQVGAAPSKHTARLPQCQDSWPEGRPPGCSRSVLRRRLRLPGRRQRCLC